MSVEVILYLGGVVLAFLLVIILSEVPIQDYFTEDNGPIVLIILSMISWITVFVMIQLALTYPEKESKSLSDDFMYPN